MKEWIESHFAEYYKLLKTLAAIPAPSHEEDGRVSFILSWLKELGVGAYADAAKNVIVPFGIYNGEDVTVISAHTDVVFPDKTPLPVREECGRLYAPGVGDDTANAAAILMIIKYLMEKGLAYDMSGVIFALNSCEEGLGNLKGIRQIMKDFGPRVKAHISFDCDRRNGIVTRAIGSERWRVTARTEGGHSYTAFGKPNAIHRVAELITRLYEQKIPDIEGTRTTYNVGMIIGGTSVNTIAQEAELFYEYRSDDRAAMAEMRESFLRLVGEADCDEARFAYELIGERPCGAYVPEGQEELFKRCAEAINAVTGEAPKPCAASTDANIPLSMGIPAVAFGLFNGGGAHTRGEWIEIDSLRDGLEIGIRTLFKVTGKR